MNKHAYDDINFFVWGPKAFPKTKIIAERVGNNADLILCGRADGMPALKRKFFELPEKGQKVMMWNHGGNSQGLVETIDEQGATGLQMRANYSSEDGDCGSPIVNTNGKIVGVHFSKGATKLNNLAVPITPMLLDFKPKN